MKHSYQSICHLKDNKKEGIFKKKLIILTLSAICVFGNLCIPNKVSAQMGMLGAKTVTTTNVILNEFTTLTANAASGATSITVAASTLNTHARFSGNLAVGELVMIIQMQGAGINTADTMSSNWGAVTSYNSAGLFEFDQVASIPNGTTINLVTGLKNSYTVTGSVQVVRVPRYTNFTINAGASVTTDTWNGSTGGIVAVEAANTTTINGTINVTGLGFRGGNLKQLDICCPYATGYAELYASVYDYYGAEKGEGIAGDSAVYQKLGGLYGRGAPANGGGGGNDHNTAGGGGSNGNNGVTYNGFGNPDTTTDVNWKTAWDLDGATANFHTNVSSGGGRGGYAYAANNPSPLTTAPGNSAWGGDYRENVGGHGGRPLDNTGNRIFFGGGGGSGQANDGYGSAGANGGGIVYMISGGALSGSGAINASGDTAAASLKFDAAGGGGGGGTVVIFSNCSSISNISINAIGGKGGDQTYSKHTQESEGPGGGGGGGYVSITNANSVTINVSGGINGTTNSTGATAFIANGATKGGSGNNTLNPASPYSNGSIVGSPTVSVLPASPSYCTGGSALLTASGATTYSWSPSTGLSATSGTSVTANPTTTTTYTVTGTNSSGCSNTYNVTVTVNLIPTVSVLPASPSICYGNSVNLNASGGNTYIWSPSSGLSSSTGDSVTANPSSTSTYTVTGTSTAGCSNTSVVTVKVNPLPAVSALPLTSTICNGTIVPLNASGAGTYAWSPSSGLSSSTGASVSANPSDTTSYTVTGTDGNGCSNTAGVVINVNPLPAVLVIPATPVICKGTSVVLNASGAGTYSWSPSSGLSVSTGAAVTANPSTTSTYTITGTSAVGCSSTASVTVTVLSALVITVTPPTPAICIGKSTSLTAGGANSFTWSPAKGLSSTGGSTVTANPDSTTTYKVVGTAGTCSDSTTVTLTVNTLPSVSVLPMTPAICNGQSVPLNASGGNTYIWSPSSGLSDSTGVSVNANPSTTSSYTVTGTDGNGCSNTSGVTVTVNQLPAIAVLPASPSICVGSSVALNASGGSTYIWSPSSGLSASTGGIVNANPDTTSTYIVTGTDGNGCSNTSGVTVTVNPLPSVLVIPSSPVICAGQSIELDGKGASTYTWSPSLGLSDSTSIIVNANPTSTSAYTVTGTDENGCINTASVTVTVNPLPSVGVLPASPSICNGKSVSLTANGANTYSWSPETGAGLSDSTGTSVTASPSATASYIVTGTDVNGCSNTSGVTVTVNPLPSISVLPASPVICFGKTVLLTGNGGNSYSWSPATGAGLSDSTGTSVTANPSATASYIVTGTDVNGCSNTSGVTVTVNPLPSVSVLPASPAICFGKSVLLTGNGGNTYSWSPSTGLSASTGTSVTANPSSTASYLVTGTDVNGCSNTSGVTVTVNPLPSISVLPASPAICFGKSVLLTANGGNTYSWSPSTGLSASTGTSVTASPSGTASYIVTGTDVNGCSNTSGVTVTVNPLPSISVLPASPAICFGKSVLLTANGGNTYSWSPSTGLSASTGTSVTASPSGTASYIVTGTDVNGCSNTSGVTVTVNPLPTISVLPASPAICFGKSVLLSGNGGNTYSWSPSTGLSGSTGTSVTASPSATASYLVTGTDVNGCSNTSGVTVTVNPLPSVSVLPASPAICFGKSVLLTGNGGSTYSWSPSTGLSASTGTSVTASPLGTASYIVTGTDVNGCSNTSGVTVTVNPLPSISVLPASPAICFGKSVLLTANGGSTYSWSPSTGLSASTGTSVTANPSATASYIVTGTDVNGCSNTSGVTVTVNPLPSISVLPASPAICFGKSVLLTGSGGSTYSWSPSTGLSASTGTSVTANPSATASYIVTGTDVNGCSNTSGVTVTVNPLPSISVLPASPAICFGKSVLLTGNGGNTYSWSPSGGLSASTGTSVTANPSATASYIVTGTDVNGCSNTSGVTVTVNPLPSISVLPASPAICFGKSVLLTGNGGNTYSWSPSGGLSASTGTSVTANPSSTSSYIVTGTDVNGCSNTSSVTITVNPLPVILINPATPVICNGQSVSLNASGANTYSWSPSSGLSDTTGSTVTGSPSVTSSYIITGTDTNGCSNTASINITVQSSLIITVVPPTPAICNGKATSLTAGGANTFTWSPATGLSSTSGSTVTANPTSTVTYKVIGSAGGCSDSTNVTVTVNPLPVVGVLPATPAICNGQSVILTGSGGSTYSWSPALGLSASTGTSVTANPSTSSTYIVTGTDVNGCSNSASTTVTVNPLPPIGVLPASPAICLGQSVSLTASGGSTYIWSPSSGLSSTTGTSVNANPTTTSTYIITGTDGNGCTNTASATVTVNPVPVINVLPATPAICNGQSVLLTAGGGTTYSWSPALGLSATTGTSVTANPTSSTSYVVTGTDGNGCSNTANATVTVNPLPSIGVLPSSPAICLGQSVSLTASGGSTYAWSPSSGLSSTTGTSVNANPTATAIYIITGTDGNGCSNTASTTVTVNPLPVINVLPATPSICNGQSVTLTASGGVTYNWIPSTGASSLSGTSVAVNPDTSTLYIVHGTDIHGCVNTSSVTVTVNPLPVISVLPAAPALCSGQSVLLTSHGGNSYAWSPSSGLSSTTGDSVTADPTATAIYIVTGTDANGCSDTSSVTVTVNPLPVINAGPDITVCPGDSTKLSITGDSPGSTYLWIPAAGLSCTSCKNPESVPLSSTDYVITVTDSKGCVGADSVNVNVFSFSVNAGTDTAVCQGSVVPLVAGGGTSYLWSPSTGLDDSTIADPTALVFSTTTYSVSVSSGSCNATATVTVTVYPAPVPPKISQSADTLLCSYDSSYVSFQWYYNSDPIPGDTNRYYIVTESGNYNLAVTDVNGCTISVGINILITATDQNHLSDNLVYLFPDPATDYLFVHAATFDAGMGASVILYSALGQQITSLSFAKDWNGKLDVNSLAAGIYFIRLQNETSEWVGRFVKE